MGRREDNKQKKRERLLSEGLRLFLELGYDRCSIELVAAAADVARGTFYLYYPDKIALFEALADRWHVPMIEALVEAETAVGAASDKQQLAMIYMVMAQRLVNVGVEYRGELLASFREVRSANDAGIKLRERDAQIRERVVRMTELAAKRGLIATDDPKLAAIVVLGAVERLYYEAANGHDVGDPGMLPMRLVALFAKTLGL